MTTLAPGNRLLVLLSFIAIYIIWGTTYLAIAVGLRDFPPFLLPSVRFIIAGLIMVGYCQVKGEPLPRFDASAKNALLGLVVLAGGQGLLIWSEQYIASGYASILVATLPIWFVIVDRKHWKTYFSNPFIIAGVLLGFGGIILLFKDNLTGTHSNADSAIQLYASIAVLVGAICWVVGSLYNRSNPARGSMYANLGWQLLAAAVICSVISASLGEWSSFQIANVTTKGLLSVVYLSLAGSIVAFVAYTWLLTQKPSAVVGTYAYINPIVAVILGYFLASEKITTFQLLGMLVILISAVLINVNKSKEFKTK